MPQIRTKIWHQQLSNISEKAKIGDGCTIHAGVHIHDEVVVGKNCKIEGGAFLPNGVILEDDVFIGPHVVFTNDKSLKEPFVISETTVRNRARIGANATIVAGVTIGEGAVIGAGAVVTKNVPAYETWVGNPAHVMVMNPAELRAAIKRYDNA